METDTKKPTAKDLLKQTNQKVAKSNSLKGMNSSEISRFISQYKPTISQVLPKHLNVERVMQICVNLVNNNPKLKECNAQSIISSVIQASELGFNPTQALGQCYFVPYKGNVQMQIGYKGYIDLARRSGQIKSLFAYCVYLGDDFKYELGLYPTIEHKPSEIEKEHSKITHVYAVAHYKDGGNSFIVLTKSEIEKLRKRNAFQKATPTQAWATDYDKMSMAKAIKQLAKWMPLSDEMQKAVTVDESIPQMNQFTKQGTNLDNVIYDIEDITPEKIEDND
jgi:recombination protein RecT